MSLTGKVALVTGSTSGIGLGIARALASEGADIMLNGFGDADQIKQIQAELAEEYSVRVHFNGADLSHPEQVVDAVVATQRELGGLDILVNNAGIQFVAPVEEFPNEKWEGILSLNLSATFYAMKAAIPMMKSKHWGRIINIASAHGLVASPNKIAYVAAKHGVVGATKVAALELANEGVTVNALCPGWVLTPLVAQQLRDRAAESGSDLETEEVKLLAEKQPMHSFTSPESIGAMVVFLCSDAAQTITGAPLSIDGGWVAQ
ncbi:MAG: Oxidoreductase/SDR, 3-hydroxybutyrate dehydrogenase [Acidimicrobiaceae bacterium]|nr:Oxidoreductase/SDR, 3-hydroxybutyrate dehydrogenase [Acidimicrobiaceae bacterium]